MTRQHQFHHHQSQPSESRFDQIAIKSNIDNSEETSTNEDNNGGKKTTPQRQIKDKLQSIVHLFRHQNRKLKENFSRGLFKFSWILILGIFLLICLVRQSEKESLQMNHAEMLIEDSFMEGLRKQSIGDEDTNKNSARSFDLRRQNILDENSEDEEDETYSPEVEFPLRRRHLNGVCDHYNEQGSGEHMIANLSSLEIRRKFLLNYDLTFCFNDIENSEDLTKLFDNVIEEKADSDLSRVDPCTSKETSVRMSDRSGGRIRRRGDPFIMDRSSNGRPKKPENKKFSRDDSEEIECDIQEEMSMIDNRVVVVQHPMERMAHLWNVAMNSKESQFVNFRAETDVENFKDFVQYIVNDYPIVYPEEFLPNWSVCNLCAKPFRPKFIVKYEYLNQDLRSVFANLGMDDLASRKSFTRVKPKVNGEDVISDEARVLFESVPKELIEELYELYRADHELFDYDPRSYLNLGY